MGSHTLTLEEEVAMITRGVVEVISPEELLEKLKKARTEKRPLRVKFGCDPTAPDLHLGHTVVFQILKRFQDLGHTAIFLIGDFTSKIGDPTGKSQTRKPLTDAEIEDNAKTYLEQVSKILDVKRAEIRKNSEWFEKFKPGDFIRLSSKMTVARMLERDDFEKRYRSGVAISIHEFLYPLVQGHDSVELKADVELGGTDQKFNLLVGRELQKDAGQPAQVCILTPILEGLDGVQKMSKSLNNYVGITETPDQMFGKLMSISDDLMLRYYELLSEISGEALIALKKGLQLGEIHPMNAKKELAVEIISRFHGAEAGVGARAEFERVFSQKKVPDEVPSVVLTFQPGTLLMQTLVSEKLVSGTSEGRRLFQQGAVTVDGDRITDFSWVFPEKRDYLDKVGKRRWLKVEFS